MKEILVDAIKVLNKSNRKCTENFLMEFPTSSKLVHAMTG